MSQLASLAKPFLQRFVHGNPSGGGTYVSHDVVTQRLLAVLGPFTFELVEILRGHVEGKDPNPNGKSDRARRGVPALEQAVVGAVCRLTVEVDGRTVRVEEVGDCEEPHNWPHDGARMKDAMSDAIKRCAMRLGLGLHLWSQDEYVLDVALRAPSSQQNVGGGEPDAGEAPASSPPPTPSVGDETLPVVPCQGEHPSGGLTEPADRGGSTEGSRPADAAAPSKSARPGGRTVKGTEVAYNDRPSNASIRRTIAINAQQAGLTEDRRHDLIAEVTEGRTRTSMECTVGECQRVLARITEIKFANQREGA